MFEIGTRIKFKYTGLEAEILENHQDGTYTVWLMEEADESIAFEEDIVLSKDFTGIQQSEQQKTLLQQSSKKNTGPSTEDLFFSKKEQEARKLQALQPSNNKFIKAKKQVIPPSPSNSFRPKQFVDTPPQGLGSFLVFHQTTSEHYTIYLVNDTPTSFSFKFHLYLNKQLEYGFNKVIPASSYFPIGEFWQVQFNDSPKIEFSCPNFNFKRQIKLKYTKFITKISPVPLLGITTYNYFLFPKLSSHSKPTDSIKNYTLQQCSKSNQPNKSSPRTDLMDIASFGHEIDLHAEKLVTDTSEFTAKELFTIQLETLDNFITQAAKLKLREVFIIHGLGKGKLREEVDQYLRYHGDVKEYNNEFHERYGFGATKVTFK